MIADIGDFGVEGRERDPRAPRLGGTNRLAA
jgi:hypothetical protein